MWLIPILVISALVVAAASKSPREVAPAARQLPVPVGPPGVPGPISVLGEILRIGQRPPPMVVLCAIAEAESIGRRDLASDIARTFGTSADRAIAPPAPPARLALPAPSTLALPAPSTRAFSAYERGSGQLRCDPRAQADRSAQVARAPIPPPPPPQVAPPPLVAPAQSTQSAQPQLPDTDEEFFSQLHSDPEAFLSRGMQPQRGPAVEIFPMGEQPQQQQRGPVVEIFPVGTPAPRALAEAAVPASSASPFHAAVLVDQLLQLPGHAGSGVVIADPSTGEEVFEVDWLQGFPVPALPPFVDGRPLRVVIVDHLASAQPTGLPAETVAQMQEAAGLSEAADQTRAMAPGSPLPGVPDDAWREFVSRLSREAPTFSSSRHVGQFRQRRERLAELGIDPRAIDSATAQRAALDADLADAHGHAEAGGLLDHLGRAIKVPGSEADVRISLSGVLGVIQCAGLEGAVGWLESPNDRRRFPHTTQAFLHTNGVF